MAGKKQHCTTCEYFTSGMKNKEWLKAHQHHIGHCERFNIEVADSLCGCQDMGEKMGAIMLLNFDDEDLKDLRVEKTLHDYSSMEIIRELERRLNGTGKEL